MAKSKKNWSSRVLSTSKKFTSNFWDKYNYDDYSADTNSDYWLKGSLFDRKKSYFDDAENVERYDYFALAQYKRAITNFVHILTGKPDIKVNYSERGDSFTDGKTITLSASMKEKDFDSNVGLALHEASHIIYTDFDKLKSEMDSIKYYQDSLTSKQRKILERTVIGGSINASMKTILNIVEDLYIDAMTYANAPGYRGYYQALYHKYFGDSKIVEGLHSKDYSEPVMDNYIYHICNIRNPNRNLKALPELDIIWSKLDLPNIRRLANMQDRVNLAWDILDIITRHCVPKPQSDEEDINAVDSWDSIDSLVSDEDVTQLKPLSKSTLDKIKKLFDKQIELINGENKKTKLTKQAKENVDAISSVDVQTYQSAKDCPDAYDFGGKFRGVKTLIIRDVNDRFINSQIASNFGIRSYPRHKMESEVERFINLGKILAKNLKIRNEERSLTSTRQKSGALDKRLLHEIGIKNYEVFKRININQYRESYIHISIDTSGSMSSELSECIKFATMFAVASKLIKNIHVVVSVRTTTYGSSLMADNARNRGGDGMPFIMYIFDSKKDNIAKIRKLFPRIDTIGTTPEGLTFEAAMRDIKKSSANTDAFFINLCDGQPYYSNNQVRYSGDYAMKHSKTQTDRMMQNGINVLTYYIGDSRGYRDLKKTYPINCFHLNNASEITKIIRVLNGNLLKRAE
jgi:hypothetical protein